MRECCKSLVCAFNMALLRLAIFFQFLILSAVRSTYLTPGRNFDDPQSIFPRADENLLSDTTPLYNASHQANLTRSDHAIDITVHWTGRETSLNAIYHLIDLAGHFTRAFPEQRLVNETVEPGEDIFPELKYRRTSLKGWMQLASYPEDVVWEDITSVLRATKAECVRIGRSESFAVVGRSKREPFMHLYIAPIPFVQGPSEPAVSASYS